MNEHQTQVIQQCAHGSLAGKLTFPEIVGQLAQIGIERYHADYSRQEITYYLPDGRFSRHRHASSFARNCGPVFSFRRC